jgi:hypothetical protein
LNEIPSEALQAMQVYLLEMVAAGAIRIAASVDSSALYGGAMISYVNAHNYQITYANTTYSGSHISGASVNINIEDPFGVTNPFDNNDQVSVVVTGGGAASPLINGKVAPVVVTFVGGVASVVVTASSAGTVVLGLASGPTNILVTSASTVTLA